ncbi:Vesicle transport protein SFT2B [Vanrija pseudolonga]|uniref:Protein transport protein SFT2 n=1 Tax=Vanrija pseudolonga TaxID=143232 RepID=A0AAF0Y964_9TREE|nr:Vesicle transport protein SFT2B [Vanrija pseudolonga]
MPQGWFNLDNQNEESIFNNEKPQFDLGLTRMQRLYAFAGCYGAGFLISLLGGIFLVIGLAGAFAVLFGIGAIVSVVGTGFLIGFGRQLKLMFKPVRIVATIVMFAAIGMCFVAAFVMRPAFLCIIFVIIEYLAMAWYSLSYIPYARSAVKNLVSSAV